MRLAHDDQTIGPQRTQRTQREEKTTSGFRPLGALGSLGLIPSGLAIAVVVAGCRPPGYGKDQHADAAIDGAGSGSGVTPDAAIDAPPAAVCHHTFRLDGHGTASQVLLTGDFVQWASTPPAAPSFTLGTDGAWTVTHDFAQGTYQYKLIVDGNWITDPTNQMTVDDGMGHTNSVYTCVP